MKKLILLLVLLVLLTSCEKETPTAGNFVLSGDITEPLVINADKAKTVEIVLDGVNMTCNGVAPIKITEAQQVIVTLANGSENTITVGSAFTEDDKANSAIYSKADIVFKGNGTLTLSNPYGHGIEAKDDLVIEGGSYTVTASEHGFQANDSIQISNGSFVVNSGKDGFHAENEEDAEKGYIIIENGIFEITSQLDGISAGAYMTLDNGKYTVTAGNIANISQIAEAPAIPQLPEGMEMPDRGQMQLPEGMEMPDRGQMQRPEGMEKPNREQWGQGMRWDGNNNTQTSAESTKGIKAGGVLTVNGGEYTITSEDDCIHSNSDIKVLSGVFTLFTGDDGFHADANLSFAEGNVQVITSYEALEGESIDIHSGVFTLSSTDDGINAAGGADQSGFGFRGDMFGSSDSYINLAGGTLTIDAQGDGIDSNGSLTVSGGDVTVLGPVSGGNSPIDWQTSGEVTGGTVIAVGNSSMAMNFNEALQGSVFYVLDSYTESGKTVQLADSEGNILFEKIIDKQYNCVLISSPLMTKNGAYTIIIDGEECPFTLEGFTYSNGRQSGFGGGFGGRGQKGNGNNNI